MKSIKVIITKISPPLDTQLVELLMNEFIEMERRFVLQDWEPATLDGGQFSEILSRIIYHVDSGNLNKIKSVDSCLSYIEDEKNSNSHNFPQRRTSLHMCKVLRTIYKFRSQRGAVHIDPEYSANEIDSSMLISNVRWLMAEILRIFWTADRKEVANTIKEIVHYNVPAVLSVDNKYFVLRTDCTAEEEILLLLHKVGDSGLSRNQIGDSVPLPASTISEAISRLTSKKKREVLLKENNTYVLTPNGSRRIYKELSSKLQLN